MTLIHLLSLSLDTNLFDQSSDVFARQQEYAKYFSHTTILVLNFGRKYSPVHTTNLDIIPVNAMGKLDLVFKTKRIATKLFKTNPYQLITTQDPLVSGHIGKQLKEKLHVPLNIQVHTDIFNAAWRKQTWQNKIMYQLVTPNLQSADSIRVVSETLKLTVAAHTTSSVFVAPVRVDLHAFYKPAHYRTSCIHFISIGRLVPEKNYGLLIESFSQVVKVNPMAKLTIIGDGPEKDRLASQIVNFGLNDEIFLVGKKTLPEIASLLHKHDAFLLTSNYEGWGMVYVEAFAAGLPVITTPVSSVGELLQPNINCLIADNATDYAQRILYLISHPEEAYRFGKNGQMWVKQNLESQVLVKRWIDGLYQTVAA